MKKSELHAMITKLNHRVTALEQAAMPVPPQHKNAPHEVMMNALKNGLGPQEQKVFDAIRRHTGRPPKILGQGIEYDYISHASGEWTTRLVDYASSSTRNIMIDTLRKAFRYAIADHAAHSSMPGNIGV